MIITTRDARREATDTGRDLGPRTELPRKLAGLLATGLVALSLGACGGDGGDDDPAPDPGSAPAVSGPTDPTDDGVDPMPANQGGPMSPASDDVAAGASTGDDELDDDAAPDDVDAADDVSAGTQDGAPDGDDRPFGVVAVGELDDRFGGSVSVRAVFRRPGTFVGAILEPDLVVDDCEVYAFFYADSPYDENAVSPTLDAGDALTFTGPGGTWLTLARGSNLEGQPAYEDSTIVRVVPDGLVVDVPGAEFPAFANAAVPDVERLSITSPGVDEPLDADTVVRWEPAPSGEVTVEWGAYYDDVSAFASCTPVDDGSHSLPAAAADYLDAALEGRVFPQEVIVTREARSTVEREDAVLIVYRRSADIVVGAERF